MNNKLIGIIVGVVAAVIAIFLIVGMVAPQDSTNSDHKVTYDGNGGLVNGQTQYTYNEANFVDTVKAEWSGHAFNGWYSDKACTTKMVSGTKINSDITVYAGWTVDYKMYATSTSIKGPGAFSVVTKTGNVAVQSAINYSLPDSGTTRIVSTLGSNFEVIEDSSKVKCLKFIYNSRSYYALAEFSGITGSVKIGVEGGGASGYFEFSYNSDVTLSYFKEGNYGLGYSPNGGTIKGSAGNFFVYNDFTCKSDTFLELEPPAGKTFAGWYTQEEGGTKVEVGTTVPFDSSKVVMVYAHYT